MKQPGSESPVRGARAGVLSRGRPGKEDFPKPVSGKDELFVSLTT